MAKDSSEISYRENDGQSVVSSGQAYRYTELPTSNSIRLMELHSSRSEGVTINLTIVDLDSAPPYEAISYVWGDPNFQVNLTCGGKSLKVTPNLRAALHHLRPQNGTRMLWADATCIDQENLEERSQQVKIMSTIYSTAIRTLVWLGTNNDDNTKAIPLMNKIGKLFCEANKITFANLRKLDSFYELKQFSIEKLRPFEPSAWTNFFEFYDNPYFCRTWCIREVNVSKEAIALYGQKEIDFTLIALAAYWASYESEKMEAIQYMSTDQGIAHAYFMRSRNLSTLSLRELLREAGSFECTDQRDKIYSTLDFGGNGRTSWISPDYTKSVVDIYIQATIQMMKEERLYFLAHIFHHPSMLDDWPSWVPRWTFSFIMPLYAPRYNASGTDDAFKCELIGDKLKVRGCCIEMVMDVTPRNSLDWISFDYTKKSDGRGPLIELWAKYTCISKEKLSETYANGEDLKTAFSKTMVVGYDFNLSDFNTYSKNLLTTKSNHFERFMGEEDTDSDPCAYQLLAQQCSNNRVFFETENGYIGLGPLILEPHDQIWILLGGRIPMVLRPTGNMYQVVGACYIHGYMNGEAIQGLEAGSFLEQQVVLC